MDENLTDKNEDARPNAAYKLSQKNQDKNNLTFYYSREGRLAKAPQEVRDLYLPKKPRSRFGIFGSMFGNKGNIALLGSIIIICAAIMLIRILDPQASHELEGNRIIIQAVKYEGTIIVRMEKSISKNWFGKNAASIYTGPVEIGVSPVLLEGASESQENQELFLHRVFFSAAGTEEYRFALPFETDSFIMVLQTEKSQISFTVKAD